MQVDCLTRISAEQGLWTPAALAEYWSTVSVVLMKEALNPRIWCYFITVLRKVMNQMPQPLVILDPIPVSSAGKLHWLTTSLFYSLLKEAEFHAEQREYELNRRRQMGLSSSHHSLDNTDFDNKDDDKHDQRLLSQFGIWFLVRNSCCLLSLFLLPSPLLSEASVLYLFPLLGFSWLLFWFVSKKFCEAVRDFRTSLGGAAHCFLSPV